jgi:hypothetical protein
LGECSRTLAIEAILDEAIRGFGDDFRVGRAFTKAIAQFAPRCGVHLHSPSKYKSHASFRGARTNLPQLGAKEIRAAEKSGS